MPDHKPVADRFKDKVAIVTGGANGIGLAVVEQLLAEGARVAFSDLNEEDGSAAASRLDVVGNGVLFVPGNMGDDEFCHHLVSETVRSFGRIDCLVNNAFSFVAAAMNAQTADWTKSYFVGPVAFARMTQLVAARMEETGGGAIVNISSISAHIAQKDRWTYNMSKGAVDQFTKCACARSRPDGRPREFRQPGLDLVARSPECSRGRWGRSGQVRARMGPIPHARALWRNRRSCAPGAVFVERRRVLHYRDRPSCGRRVSEHGPRRPWQCRTCRRQQLSVCRKFL